MSKSLPIILKNTNILLLGAGNVAKQKYDVLLDNGYIPKVISLENTSNLENVILKNIEINDFRNFNIVIDATASNDIREIVFKAKEKYNFLLNRVDIPNDCDFYFASLINRKELKIAVSTNGASPTIGQEIRDFIAKMIPKDVSLLLDETKKLRQSGLIDVNKTKKDIKHILGSVHLIGCGIGDVELLTIKAYKSIMSMDIVFIDHLISDEIVSIIPKTTKQIYVGKEKDKLIITQEEINHLLLKYANQGLKVGRLKSGDPYIFGRGAEEAMFLAKNKIKVEVISGISSPIGGSLSAGIAPTARGYATNMSIVSAHLQGNQVNLEWIDILKMKNHTTVVLMAISRANEITKKAIEIGVDENLPTAVISNASRENQEVFITQLSKLPIIAINASKPAFIIFGDVVKLYGKLPIN